MSRYTRFPWPLWAVAAVAVASCAAEALAWGGPRMTLEPGERDCFALVLIENRAGLYNQTETLETEYGPVSIRYQTIGGHGPGHDDRIEVVSLPEGVFARPMQAEIVDGESLAVCLYEFTGM